MTMLWKHKTAMLNFVMQQLDMTEKGELRKATTYGRMGACEIGCRVIAWTGPLCDE